MASKTNKDPQESLKELISSKDNKKLDIVINDIAIHIFFEIISLKITNAIIEVQTISKLFNNDALDDELSNEPNINNIGTIISRTIIPITKGISFLFIFSSGLRI